VETACGIGVKGHRESGTVSWGKGVGGAGEPPRECGGGGGKNIELLGEDHGFFVGIVMGREKVMQEEKPGLVRLQGQKWW